MRQRLQSGWRISRWALLVVVVFVLLLLGFGISGEDAQKLRAFADAASRWQHGPEFRQVTMEYVLLSNGALRTRPFGIQATKTIMALRSIPGLPEHLAVSATSQAHYDDFTRGPLSAYLRLAGEQGVTDFLPVIENLGAEIALSDDHVQQFLASFSTQHPVARDKGAMQSVRKLVIETEAVRPFRVRQKVDELLQPRIAEVARRLGAPEQPANMSADQQALVLTAMDDHVRKIDHELWRTKQVNDFLAGVWSQTYGPMYRDVMVGVLVVRWIARAVLVLIVVAIVTIWINCRSRFIDRNKTQLPAEKMPS